MGNYGFDLVSWYVLKNWLDTREKMLALRKSVNFNQRTQYMQMYPEPGSERFWGILECYVEQPIQCYPSARLHQPLILFSFHVRLY